MRIRRGLAKKRKHKSTLKAVKGYRLSYSKLYRRAKEALLHSGQYSYNHRRKRPGQFRKIWIQRINAALQIYDIKYSQFISKLKKAKIEIDRKMLAELAVSHENEFKAIVEKVK